jgi:hypothetical protein
MEEMSASAQPPDLLDLKLMPAWVKEPSAAHDYSNFKGEDSEERARPGRSRPTERARHPDRPRAREGKRDRNKRRGLDRHQAPPARARAAEPMAPVPVIAVRFLPHAPVLERDRAD